ncbi:MAG: hypothetical protein ACOYOV_18140 [Bacteroidales bacterium]
MKQQIIEFYLDYINSGLEMAKYARKKNLTANECKIIIKAGIGLSYNKDWEKHKLLIEQTMVRKNLTPGGIARMLGLPNSRINEVIHLQRGLNEKLIEQIKNL